MNNLKEYIIEKFKIHKGVSVTTTEIKEVVENILKLCGLKRSDKIYLEAIKTWVEENQVEHVRAICDKHVLSHVIPRNEILNDFTHNATLTKDLAKKLIEDGEGKEILGEKWKDPKIYYDESTLIFHDHTSLLGNIDRIFLKSNN